MEKNTMKNSFTQLPDIWKLLYSHLITKSIKKLIRPGFQNIDNKFDVWNTYNQKLLKKKKLKADAKGYESFLQLGNIRWLSAATFGEYSDELTKKFTLVLHHICNVHKWEDYY